MSHNREYPEKSTVTMGEELRAAVHRLVKAAEHDLHLLREFAKRAGLRPVEVRHLARGQVHGLGPDDLSRTHSTVRDFGFG